MDEADRLLDASDGKYDKKSHASATNAAAAYLNGDETW